MTREPFPLHYVTQEQTDKAITAIRVRDEDGPALYFEVGPEALLGDYDRDEFLKVMNAFLDKHRADMMVTAETLLRDLLMHGEATVRIDDEEEWP